MPSRQLAAQRDPHSLALRIIRMLIVSGLFDRVLYAQATGAKPLQIQFTSFRALKNLA